MKKGNNKSGFSLLELIIVISIMSILGAIITPQIVKHVTTNRATACRTDREAILAVFERCIYAQTKALVVEDLEDMLIEGGVDVATWNEVKQYNACPSSGHFTAEVLGDVAIIHCDCSGHDDAVVDFNLWSGTELAEGLDAPIDPPTPPAPEPPAPEPPESEEPSSSEPPVGDWGYWPYADSADGSQRNPVWEGKRFPGQVVEVPVPSGLFESRGGNMYVVIDRSGGTGVFPVYWEWALGPENIDSRGWEQCISWSGVKINDVESIRFYQDGQPVAGTITGIHYGDILVYGGRSYIYASHDESPQKPEPDGTNGGNNFYFVDP